jgi:hypothetical protein
MNSNAYTGFIAVIEDTQYLVSTKNSIELYFFFWNF